jgi:exopolysaccharide biosynthesis polyprenyl glycosylphosphotransferase
MRRNSSAASRLTALRAQQMLGVLAFGVAPAAAGGLLAVDHLHSGGRGAIVFFAILFAYWAGERGRIPLHLMPLAELTVRTLVPIFGVAIAVAIFSASGTPVYLGGVVAPILGAWAAVALGAWVVTRFELTRPIRIAVIGSPTVALGLSHELSNSNIRSHVVVGWIADDRPTTEPGAGPRRLGSFAQVGEVVQRHAVDLLVHSLKPAGDDAAAAMPTRLELFERVAAECLDLPVSLIEVGQLYEELLGHVPLGQSNSAWFQYMLHPRYRAGWTFSKRIFDIVIGGVMLLLLAPVLAAFAIAVKLTDGGPVFYRQRRMGERGREFELVKLRSMLVASEDEGPLWSEAEDDRVTAVGRFMRRFHIDEMPQLINILRGEMTLIGPRPERRELIIKLEKSLAYYDRRHLVKPGLAGWAQARCGYGGSEEGTSWKLCHDLYYLKHRSLYVDTLILIENFRVSLGKGVQFGLHAPHREFILGQAGKLGG